MYTFEEVKQIASKYEFISDFQKNDFNAYFAACYHNWMKDFTWFKRKSGYSFKKGSKYSFEEVKQIALKYEFISDFQKNDLNAYSAARYHNWMKDFTWLKRKADCSIKRKQKYSLEEIKQVALKYSSRKEFAINDGTLYQYAVNHKMLDSFEWMKSKNHIITDEEIISAAKNYNSIESFKANHFNLYEASIKRTLPLTWLVAKEAVSEDECYKIAMSCLDKKHFQISHNECYVYCLYHGWIDKWFDENDNHVPPMSKEDIHKIAMQYHNCTEFRESQYKFFIYAQEHGWIDEWFTNDTGKQLYKHDYKILGDLSNIDLNNINIAKIVCAHSKTHPEIAPMLFYTDNYVYDKHSIRFVFKKQYKLKLNDVSTCSYEFYKKRYIDKL